MSTITKKMTPEEIHEMVVGFTSDLLNVEKEEVTTEADFVNDLGADSLDFMEIIMEIEKITGIQIGNVAEGKLSTVGDLEKLLLELLG